MAINFTYYPTSNRVPGVYVEMDPSQANTGTALQNTLLIGQKLAAGTAPPDLPACRKRRPGYRPSRSWLDPRRHGDPLPRSR